MATKKDNKPAPQPSKPASQPAKPASQPAKPASQPAKPASQPSQQTTTRSTPASTPPSKTEEERRIDKINQLRDEGKLTQNEAQELRQFAKEMSNEKGNLTAAEEKAFTDALNKSLTSNVKGNDPFNPPKSGGGKGDGGKGDGGKGDGGKGDGGKGDGGKGDGGGGSGGGGNGGGGNNGGGDTKALIKIIEQLQKDIADLKKSNDILNKKLENLSEVGSGGEVAEGVSDEQEAVDDDAASVASDTPVTRSSAKSTINIPKPSERANIPYPSDAERVYMPNIDVRVKKEVDRITMSLIKSAREFLEAGIDYEGINQVPSKPELSDDGLLFYDPIEENQSEPSEQSLAAEVMGIVSNSLAELLSTGDPTNKEKYNYIEFLNLFDLRYNANGDPVFDLNVAIEDGIIEGLKAYRVKTDEIGNDVRVGEL